MHQKKLRRENIRKLTKLGGHSLAVTIPITLARQLHLKERQKVVVQRRGRKIVIKDWRR